MQGTQAWERNMNYLARMVTVLLVIAALLVTLSVVAFADDCVVTSADYTTNFSSGPFTLVSVTNRTTGKNYIVRVNPDVVPHPTRLVGLSLTCAPNKLDVGTQLLNVAIRG